MPVLGLLSYTLEVPSVEEGVRFYSDAGLVVAYEGAVARLSCAGHERASVMLMPGPRKRLHHVTLRASGLEEIAKAAAAAGGGTIAPPAGFGPDGRWVRDPNGIRYHLVEQAADPAPQASPPFLINAPGRIARTRRSAMLPVGQYPPARPSRLGHVLMFTPDVMASVRFVTEALGMGLADHSGDVVAFCCARRDSDHHVLAFAKSDGIGFHHGSFELADPDAVGRAGRALLAKAGRGDWGFGRHTIGSNFFHYVQDPWGSWFEYYSDMDHIDDYTLWTPTDYAPEDSMANWGPPLPEDFALNREAECAGD